MTNKELTAIPSEKMCLVSKRPSVVFTYKEHQFITTNKASNWGFSVLTPDPKQLQGIHNGNGYACYIDAKIAAVEYIDSLVRFSQ